MPCRSPDPKPSPNPVPNPSPDARLYAGTESASRARAASTPSSWSATWLTRLAAPTLDRSTDPSPQSKSSYDAINAKTNADLRCSLPLTPTLCPNPNPDQKV